uniref:Transmembrane protein n=1 Tax=Phytophthora ramorum TaxID=164328 RepID=H3GRD2_PHYRM
MASTGPSKHDLSSLRLSYVSGASQAKDTDHGYSTVKTPDPASLEGGALRAGEVPSLTSKDSIGLLFQYAVVGINYGLLPATVYPFLQQYLNATGSQNVFSSISYTASSPVQSYMVGVTPINNTISEILSNVMFMAGIMATSRWGLHWSWRKMIILTGVFVVIVDGFTTFITIWDVFRSQWFWLGLPMAVQLPYGVGWLIANFVIVELSGVGNEGVIYGLITMVGNLASPFAQALTLVINQPLNLTTARIQADDTSIRTDLSYAVSIMYGMTIFSWVFLVFLPRQKEETQELLRTGGSSKILGGLTLGYVLFALVWSLMTNIMAMYESTSCLVIAGGKGC